MYNYDQMKIYFNYSTAGEKQYFKEYSTLVKLIRKLNHEVISDQILGKKYQSSDKKEVYKQVQDKKKLIKISDAVIVESTYPSIGIGYLVGYALGQHKNVLVLYQNSPHAVFLGDTNRLLTIKKYEIKNENKILRDIEKFLKSSKNKILKYRFNMMIDQSMDDFLSIESIKKRISKADYVRQLIGDKKRTISHEI